MESAFVGNLENSPLSKDDINLIASANLSVMKSIISECFYIAWSVLNQ
tara:strand:- start:123 stop:266 length:144 start_codon:yes stop_codon:yes gene_type:complete